jgi:hypothetical protein
LFSRNVQIKAYTNLILPVVLGVINKELGLRETEIGALRVTFGARGDRNSQDDEAQ